MAQPPKHPPTPPRPATPPPRPTTAHAPAKPPLHEPEAKKPEPEPKPAPAPKPEPVDVAALALSANTHTAVARLQAARAEVAGWTHNLESSLAADLDAGALTEPQAKAVAEKYEVKAPKPHGHPDEAKETTPEMNEAAAAQG